MNPEEALHFIADQLNTTVELIKSKRRKTHIIYNRHLASYVLKKSFYEITWKEVGDLIDRDHSTVIHSFKVVEEDSIEGILEIADSIVEKVKIFDLNYEIKEKVKFIYPSSSLNGLYKMQIV